MPTCRKCTREAPPDAAYCPYCGTVLTPLAKSQHKPRTRPNGTGTAFKRGKSWYAQVTVGWKTTPNFKSLPIRRTKGGFKTKRDALEYCAALMQNHPKRKAPNLIEYWTTYHGGEFEKLKAID